MRNFGVEIETCSCDYNNAPSSWEMVHEHCGLEFVSPIMSGEAGLDSVRDLYARIKPEVNHQCGLHVHVDVRDFTDADKLELVARLIADKNLFTSRVNQARLDNGFCDGDLPSLQDTDTWEGYVYRLHGDRYCWVNLLAVRKHGSIEFRLHEATEDPEKVVAWIEFLVSYVENVRTGQPVTECPACVNQSFINSQVDMLVSNLWSD